MAERMDDNVYQIRHDIDRTAAEMHETIDAIRRKLEPDRLKQQAQDAVKEATIGRAEDKMSKAMGKAEDAVSNARDTAMGASSGIMDTVRRNPIPAALAGIGLGWILMNRSEGERSSGSYDRTHPYFGEPGTQSHYGRSASYYGEPSTGRMSGRSEAESQGALDQVSEKASETRQAAAEMMDRVRAKAGDMMGDTGEMAVSRGTGLMDTIRENPLAAAVAGLGLGWLFMNGGSREERSAPDYYSRSSDLYRGHPLGGYEEGRGTMDEARSRARDTMEQAQGTVGDLAGRAQETIGDAGSRVQETIGDASSRVQDTMGDVSDRVQQQVGAIGDQTRRQYGRVEDRFQETLNTNPLAVGAAAIAVGAVAAMLAPPTQQERRFMGETRDSLMEQVQSTAQDTLEKVQRVAEHAQESVKTEAKEEGLTQ